MGRPPKVQPTLPQISSQADLDVEEFLEEIGPSETVVEIYRFRDDGRRPQCGTVTLDLFRENPYHYLRATYGPGRYGLRFKGVDRKYIEGSIVMEVESAPTNNPQPAPAPAQPAPNTSTDLILQMMQSQNQFMQTLLLGMMQSFKAPDLTPLLALMKPPDLLATVSALKSLTTNEEKQSSVKDTLEVLEAARGFLGDGNGGSEKGGDMITLATTLGGKVLEVISNAQQNNRRQIPEVIPGSIPVGAQPVEISEPQAQLPNPQPLPAQNPPKVDEHEMLKKWLTEQLAFLKAKAKAGKDVEFWIEYVIDNSTDEPGCAAILQAIDRGATLDHLCAFDEEIANDPLLKAWFEKLYDGLQPESESAVQSDLQPEMVKTGERGNGSNGSTNGGTGAEIESNGQRAGKEPKKQPKH